MEIFDWSQGGLLGLSVVAGGFATDLLAKGNYVWGTVLLVVTGVFVFSREYFKVS